MMERVQWYKDRGEKPDYYIILRNSLMGLYWVDVLFATIYTLFSECGAVYYNYFIGDLIRFIKSDVEMTEDNVRTGARLVGTFLGLMVFA